MTVIVCIISQREFGVFRKRIEPVGLVFTDLQAGHYNGEDPEELTGTSIVEKVDRFRQNIMGYSGMQPEWVMSMHPDLKERLKISGHNFINNKIYLNAVRAQAQRMNESFSYVFGHYNWRPTFLWVNQKEETGVIAEGGQSFARGCGSDSAEEILASRNLDSYNNCLKAGLLAVQNAIKKNDGCGYGVRCIELRRRSTKLINLKPIEKQNPFDYDEHTRFSDEFYRNQVVIPHFP
tara:strand:+ start:1446 stop:2150 length:705 start_codon:yes stop_codon:yes gene_type:complete